MTLKDLVAIFSRGRTAKPAPAPKAPADAARVPKWRVFGVAGRKSYTVQAWTKSEARAVVKREIAIGRKGRLPLEVEILAGRP